MSFTRKERFALVNQFQILEKVDPANKDAHVRAQRIFEAGYEDECESAMDAIDPDGFGSALQKVVIDTLDMFVALRRSYDALADKTGFTEHDILFSGFDGNDALEGKCKGYARFLVEVDNKFVDVKVGQAGHFDFNSHMELLENYKRMITVWHGGVRHNMDKARIKAIIDARAHPRS